MLEVLRSMRALDAALRPHCRRKLHKLDAEVRVALRIGLAETMCLDVPPALATDGAVRLIRRLGKTSAAGMVNAVLRKATTRWRDTLADSPIDVRLSHPEWIFRRWGANFGERGAEAAMASAQKPATTWVWFFDDTSRHEMVDDGIELESHPWCPNAWSSPKSAGRLIEVVKNGGAYAQDPSSQLVAHGALSLAGSGDAFVDLCAAPGGKTALLLHHRRWNRAVAADRSLTRTRLVQQLVDRSGGCAVLTADATSPSLASRSWDLVLLDAPCSGTGTFRRHPELKWRLTEESIGGLARMQSELLTTGMKLVSPGGVLLFSTCSIEPEENEGVVADLPKGCEIENLEPHLPDGVPSIPTSAGGIRILPNPAGDGFTMHAVRRIA
jgi:16S rRNA (cytosine967-C5)-methyltransferase